MIFHSLSNTPINKKLKTLADKITDCAHTHFAWDADEKDPGTKKSLKDFKSKVTRIIRLHKQYMKKTLSAGLIIWAVIALVPSAWAKAAESTDSLTNAVVASDTNDVTKFDLELGGAGDFFRGGSGGVNASLYANPFVQCRSLWVGASQTVSYGPASGETDLGTQWTINLWNQTLFANPGWQIGVRYGDDSRAFLTGPQFELQWYYNDSTYLYGSTGISLASRGQSGGWFNIGVGLEF